MTEPASSSMIAAELELGAGDWRMQVRLTVPAEAVPLRRMLPLVQALADAVVDSAAQLSTQNGQPISCKKGCGACCRQLVPISAEEARNLRDLVAGLAEPRRSLMRARFAAAHARLHEAGLLHELQHSDAWTDASFTDLGMRYFRLGIACPFLEDESCSIYADRPVTCREYLVTSPAEHCADPSPESVRRVPLPMRVCMTLAEFHSEPSPGRYLLPVPLILSLDESSARPEPPFQTGPTWLQTLLQPLAPAADPP